MRCPQTHVSAIGFPREVELPGGRGGSPSVLTVYAGSVRSLTFAEIHLRGLWLVCLKCWQLEEKYINERRFCVVRLFVKCPWEFLATSEIGEAERCGPPRLRSRPRVRFVSGSLRQPGLAALPPDTGRTPVSIATLKGSKIQISDS